MILSLVMAILFLTIAIWRPGFGLMVWIDIIIAGGWLAVFFIEMFPVGS